MGIRGHEPWADEAQAWLIARDMPWVDMMMHGVRYEGSPGLWHSILWVLIRMHLGYQGLAWLAGGFAACGVIVLFRFAPFPRPLRLLLPFTFFIAYQDAVIVRSYVLFALLTFSAVALLRRARPAPAAIALLLGLLANLSAHGFAASLGFAVVAMVRWRDQGVSRLRRRACLALFLCFLILSIGTAAPPGDISSSTGRNVGRSLHNIAARHVQSGDREQVLPGELSPVIYLEHKNIPPGTGRILRILSLITYPISTYRVLGLAVFAALIGMVWRPRVKAGWILLLPYFSMLAIFQSLYMAPRHAGTLFIVLLSVAWLAWPRDAKREPRTLLLSSLLVIVCVEQITWTAHAVWSDVHLPYCGGLMTAEFLAEHLPGRRAAAFYYHAVDTLPYFDHDIYENRTRASYWYWSTKNRIDQRAPFALERRPDYVVIGGWNWGDNADITVDWESSQEDQPIPLLTDPYRILPYALAHGYRRTHQFCGHAWMRNGYSELLCDVIVEPVDTRKLAP
jgi:hypothetical protein